MLEIVGNFGVDFGWISNIKCASAKSCKKARERDMKICSRNVVSQRSKKCEVPRGRNPCEGWSKKYQEWNIEYVTGNEKRCYSERSRKYAQNNKTIIFQVKSHRKSIPNLQCFRSYRIESEKLRIE